VFPSAKKKTKGLWLRVLLPFRILKKPRFLGRTSGKHPPLPANQANQAQPRPCDTWHIKPEQFYGFPHPKKKREQGKNVASPPPARETLWVPEGTPPIPSSQSPAGMSKIAPSYYPVNQRMAP